MTARGPIKSNRGGGDDAPPTVRVPKARERSNVKLNREEEREVRMEMYAENILTNILGRTRFSPNVRDALAQEIYRIVLAEGRVPKCR